MNRQSFSRFRASTMLFDVFSKRNKPLPDVFQYDELSLQLRNQVAWIWKETIHRFDDTYHRINPIFEELRDVLCAEHGLGTLAGKRRSAEDVYEFLHNSNDVPVVLALIELSFRLLAKAVSNDTDYILHPLGVAEAIRALNHRFRENGVGYELSPDNLRLIRIDNTAIHQNAVKPALQILTGKEYNHANEEMLAAFDDYKKGDYDDCLAKCCSAFESVLKVIHHREKWPFLDSSGVPVPTPIEKAPAGPLVTSYIQNSGLESFFDQPLMIIGTLRNRLSSAHGQGTQPKNVPESLARFAVNATTSAILLLHEHA
jgi:hypothetical protein